MDHSLILFGTGHFALPTFEALMKQDDARISAVYTQPERKGRGHHRHVNPIKELALQHGIPVFQPENVNSQESLQQLRQLNADLYVVAAYGQILKPEFLEIPRLGAFNLHGSLLPRHRGAAPVQYSIWKGDRLGGVTMFQIEQGLDCGPIVGVVETEIGAEETSGQLMERLANLSVELTQKTVLSLLNGTAEFHVQDHDLATKAPKIPKQAGVIDWTQSAREIDCHVRAMQPWPKATTELLLSDRKPLVCQIQRVCVADFDLIPEGVREPGEIEVTEKTATNARQLLVCTGEGWVQVQMLQPSGKKTMTAEALINGYGVNSGDRFFVASS